MFILCREDRDNVWHHGVSVLADAEEESQGGQKGFIGVQMGLLASNPVITGVGDRLPSVRSPVWSRRGRRRALPGGSQMSAREKEGPVVSDGRERGGCAC